MPENIALCHSLLTDEGVPLNGPFAPLSLADRLTGLIAKLHAAQYANKVLRDEKAVLEEQLAVACDRAQSWKNLCDKYKELAEARGEALDKRSINQVWNDYRKEAGL